MTDSTIAAFLSDPADPRWSSTVLQSTIDKMPGDALTRTLSAIRELDDIAADASVTLTFELTNFIRSVTLYGYKHNVVPIDDVSQIDWLIARFTSSAIAYRALCIALLVDINDLNSDVRSAIINTLLGTDGERFLDRDILPQNGG